MANIGYLLLCDDVAYSEKEDNHFVKNPLDVLMLDKTPSRHSFYMLASLFNVNTKIEYVIEVEIFDRNMNKVSSMDTTIIFSSDPPRGKSGMGVITLKIHHENFQFKSVGVHKLTLKISEKDSQDFSFKEIEFPVVDITNVEGNENE